MPTYEVEVGGKVHEIDSESALSDAQLGEYVKSVGAPAKASPPEKKAPFTIRKSQHQTETDVAEAAGGFLGDVASAFNRGVVDVGTALGQLAEKPLSSLANTVAGRKIFPGDVASRAGKVARESMLVSGPPREENPVAGAVGQAGAALLPSSAVAGVLKPAASTLGRVGQTAGLGGVQAMASQPAEEGKDFTTEKFKQGGAGAALAGGVHTMAEAAPVVKGAAARTLFGTPGSEQKRLWDRAKEMGFLVRPDQARQDASRMLQSGVGEKESLANQKIANKEATVHTGRTGAVTPEFLSERYKTLGGEFEEVYAPGTKMKVDIPAIENLRDFVEYEKKIGYPWSNTKASAAANRLIGELENVQAAAGKGKVTNVRVDAQDIQRLRTELQNAQRATNDKIDKEGIRQVIDQIDESVERNHPHLAAKLAEIRPKYWALTTLDTAAKRGIVDTQGNISLTDLGRFLRQQEAKYARGESRHPLAELGQIGENFGIRSIGQARVTAGQGPSAGAVSDEIPVTKAGMYRTLLEYGKKAAPGYRAMHEKYLKGGSALTEQTPEEMTTRALTMGAARNEGSDR